MTPAELGLPYIEGYREIFKCKCELIRQKLSECTGYCPTHGDSRTATETMWSDDEIMWSDDEIKKRRA